MDSQHYQIRLPKWKTVWLSTAVIIITVSIIQSFNFYSGFYVGLMFFSGAFIWLPIILSYIFSYLIKNKEYDVQTIQRCIIFLIATIINIYISDSLLDSYSSGPTILVYMMAYPVQVVMILVFDLLLFLARKYGRKSLKCSSKFPVFPRRAR